MRTLLTAGALVGLLAHIAAAQPEEGQRQVFEIGGQPGCSPENALDPRILAAGLDNCTTADTLEAGEERYYQWAVGNTTGAMTLQIRAVIVGGTATLSLYMPGANVTGAPTLSPNVTLETATAQRAFFFLSSEDPGVWAPGEYLLRVRATDLAPTVTLSFSTSASTVRLHPWESKKMQEVAAMCCPTRGQAAEDWSRFCDVVIPALTNRTDSSWEDDLCHSPGSVCDARGHLLRLHLFATGLQCPLFPVQLAQLVHLQTLNLEGNAIPDSVAAAAGALQGLGQLREVYLAGTGLAGPLDCRLAAQGLQVLDLRGNAVTGNVLACLTSSSLREVYLSDNLLDGKLEEVNAQESALTSLWVDSQRPNATLQGSVPASLSGLVTLRYLNLARNNLTGGFEGALGPAVAWVNASGAGLTGALPALPRGLLAADFSGNALSGGLGTDLRTLERLIYLDVSGNTLTGKVPGLPASLLALYLQGNSLSGVFPTPPRMMALRLSGNDFSGDISGWDLSQMLDFRADGNSFTGTIPTSLAASQTLVGVSLYGNALDGRLPGVWNTPRLQYLDLSFNAITGTLPPALAALPMLKVLDVASNRLSGTLEPFAGGLSPYTPNTTGFSRLQQLNVSGNQLKGAVPEALANAGVFAPGALLEEIKDGWFALPRYLDLSRNWLSGQFPVWAIEATTATVAVCGCGMELLLSGNSMTCPPLWQVTDITWQVSNNTNAGWYCTDSSGTDVPITNFLASPSNAQTNITMQQLTGVAPEEDGGLSGGAIAGIVVGSLVGVALLAAAVWFVAGRRRSPQLSWRRSKWWRRRGPPTAPLDLQEHGKATAGAGLPRLTFNAKPAADSPQQAFTTVNAHAHAGGSALL